MLKTYDERSIWRRWRAALTSGSRARRLVVAAGNEPLHAQDNPDGPPDLDEMWRDFNRRLNRLFGKKDKPDLNGSGNGGSGGGNAGNGARFGIGIVIGVLLAIWLGSGIFIVQEGQAGVVLQFGKYMYTTGSGIQWRLPYPFQSQEIVNMAQVRSIEIGNDTTVQATNLKDASMLTSDENIVDVHFAVQYRISDPAAYLFNNVDPDATVEQAAETAVREIVGKHPMDYVLYDGREQVAIDLQSSIQKILDSYKTGILISSVTLQNVQPPAQVQDAFDDAVKATQDRERMKNDAQAYANKVIPQAKGDAARMLEQARGYAARVQAQAEGDADRFKSVLAQYAKAPAVTRERMYLDTMQQIYQNTTKVMTDAKGSSNMLYLPLDKLIQRSKTSAASPAPQSAPVPDGGNPTVTVPDGRAAGGADDPLRARDFLRNRDSETNN